MAVLRDCLSLDGFVTFTSFGCGKINGQGYVVAKRPPGRHRTSGPRSQFDAITIRGSRKTFCSDSIREANRPRERELDRAVRIAIRQLRQLQAELIGATLKYRHIH